MDWNGLLTNVITQTLIVVIPVVITYVIAKVASTWTQFKAGSTSNDAIAVVETVAKIAVKAAQQYGGTNEEKKQYAYGVVAEAVNQLPIKFTDEQIQSVIDASIEAAVNAMGQEADQLKLQYGAALTCDPVSVD
jgi:hypothetical protein